tara:strand:+ start:5042 stop:6172 length:1131 start_codon:yes stop_codon:yes gene_type:complete
MNKKDKTLDYEEDFYSKGKRENRKERQLFQLKDRSKYRKSDQDQKKNREKSGEPPLKEGMKRGRITAIAPGTISVIENNTYYSCTLKGSLKKEKTQQKNLITVGDWVHFKTLQDHEGSIVHIEKRTAFLGRSDNLLRRKQHLIAANVDQVLIVMSLCSPRFKPLLIDRYLLSAKKGKMKAIILINKIDLLKTPPNSLSPSQVKEEEDNLKLFENAYKPLSIPFLFLSASSSENIDTLKKMMTGHTSVFAGQSGVGKSSLINAAISTNLRVGPLVEKTGKGSHTTTGAKLIPLEGGGFCVDTPGIKSFGMWNFSAKDILDNFVEFAPFAKRCKFMNCTHLHEPSCAVKKALKEGEISILRYQSYKALASTSSLQKCR